MRAAAIAGNVNSAVAEGSALQLTITSGAGTDADGNAECPADLELTHTATVTNGRILRVTDLSIQGRPSPLASQAMGLPSFQHVADALAAPCALSQLTAAQTCLPLHLHLRVNTLTHSVPVQLLPGPPVRAALCPGHPFDAHPAALDAPPPQMFDPGTLLPPFSTTALDTFGNVCVPSPALTWSLEVHSTGLSPSPAAAVPDAAGVATIRNATADRTTEKDAGGGCAVLLRAVPASHLPGLEAAVAAAIAEAEAAEAVAVAAQSAEPGPPPLRVLLAPSEVPVELTISMNREDIKYEDVTMDGAIRRVFQVLAIRLWFCLRVCAEGCGRRLPDACGKCGHAENIKRLVDEL